jgi:hypothetical protein
VPVYARRVLVDALKRLIAAGEFDAKQVAFWLDDDGKCRIDNASAYNIMERHGLNVAEDGRPSVDWQSVNVLATRKKQRARELHEHAQRREMALATVEELNP